MRHHRAPDFRILLQRLPTTTSRSSLNEPHALTHLRQPAARHALRLVVLASIGQGGQWLVVSLISRRRLGSSSSSPVYAPASGSFEASDSFGVACPGWIEWWEGRGHRLESTPALERRDCLLACLHVDGGVGVVFPDSEGAPGGVMCWGGPARRPLVNRRRR